jgi:hypothetical protein
MTSPKLQILERQMLRQNPEPAPVPEDGHGLGAAIEKLIADEVERRVGDAMERKAPSRVRNLFNAPEPYTNFNQLPPVQKTPAKPAEFETIWHRDGAGQILWSETIADDGRRFVTKVERDGTGAIIRCKTTPPDESPVLPALAVDYKAKARTYDPGEPR